MELLAVYLGDELGYYRALEAGGPLTSIELAARTGTHERYAREWLEQQATSQFIAVDDVAATPSERRYSLPDGYGHVLTNAESEAFLAPLGRFLKVAGGAAERLVEIYRSGGGLSWEEMGRDAREAQAALNRPFFVNSLVGGYLQRVPGLDAKLAARGARVAEIGPGGGWALIALMNAYPGLTGEGFDLDEGTVAMARANIERAGVGGRLTIHHQDASTAAGAGSFDLVIALECIHDLADPVSVLRSMRNLVKPDGTVLVMDERVAQEFGAFGDPIERLMYGFSLFVCLPDGMSHQPSAATGTVLRPATLENYARQAGFSTTEILPLEHDMFRFYLLR